MNIKTAIMPVAGAGSRVFPCTTAIEKCMMPIYAGKQSRPVIDFMVEDCVLAGVKRVIFVTSERGKVQLSEYFEKINQNLREQLKRLGKDDAIEEELARRESFDLAYEYIVQPSNQYGTAFPPFLAKDYVRGEARFALMGGDDFVYRQDGTSELAAAIETWNNSGAQHVIMGKPIPQIEGPNYGILQTDGTGKLVGIDEKPPLDRIPQEPVANISRYLLSDSIWSYIEAEMAEDRGSGEHYITYPINNAVANGQTFQVHPVGGEYMDGGSFEGLMRASQYISAYPMSHLPSSDQ